PEPAPSVVQLLPGLDDLLFTTILGNLARPHVEERRRTAGTIQSGFEVIQLLLAQDLLHLLQQLRAGLVHQLAHVLLVCIDGCQSLVLRFPGEFQSANDPLDVIETRVRARTTRTDRGAGGPNANALADPETEVAAFARPSESGRELPDLVLVKCPVLVEVAQGDQ